MLYCYKRETYGCRSDKQKVKDNNLISRRHQKGNRNLIHCSETGGKRRWRGRRKCKCQASEGGHEGRQAGEKFTSTVGWSRKSYNLTAARKQEQMSHVSHPPSLPPFLLSIYIHLSFFLPHSFYRWAGLSLFLPSVPFVLSALAHNLIYHSFPSFASTSPRPPLPNSFPLL